MLKLNSDKKEFVIPMPIDETYKIVFVKEDKALGKDLVIMCGISEKEYNKIKHGDDLKITRGNSKFNISSDDVYCFGEIDFHEGSEDCSTIDTFNWLSELGSKGIGIPSRYNYDKHECTSYVNTYLYTETFSNSRLCRYLHGCLNKPQYTIIFRERIK